jgi:hypothetical protein
MPFGIEGVIIWFKLIKPVFNLELKIFGHCFISFELPKKIVVLHLTHPKPHKLLKFGYEMNKICYFKVKGVIVWSRQ